jgi:hypothetical protein
MRKFGVVKGENRLSDSTLKAPVVQEEEEIQPDLEVTQLDEEASKLQDMLDQMDAPRRSPREQWAEELEFENITEDDAAKILDAIITNGMYEETYRMGKLVVKMRTRNTSDADRVIEAIQDFKPETNGTLSHLIARMNLAASISTFGDKEFNFSAPTDGNRDQLEQEFTERYNFLSNVPSQVFFSLTQVLEKFDRRVQLACDPRAIENF